MGEGCFLADDYPVLCVCESQSKLLSKCLKENILAAHSQGKVAYLGS
jgi:hypothetical protein